MVYRPILTQKFDGEICLIENLIIAQVIKCLMKGFFVSISRDKTNVFVYPVKYFAGEETRSSVWKPTCQIDSGDYYELIRSPGYQLFITKLDNKYLKKFFQTKEVECNGWMQGQISAYKVTRYRNDRMFLLLAMDLSTYPVDITKKCLDQALMRSGIHNANIIYMNDPL